MRLVLETGGSDFPEIWNPVAFIDAPDNEIETVDGKVAVRLRLSSLKTQQDPRQISSFCDRGSLKNQQKSTTP